jgi:hypothetical protein
VPSSPPIDMSVQLVNPAGAASSGRCIGALTMGLPFLVAPSTVEVANARLNHLQDHVDDLTGKAHSSVVRSRTLYSSLPSCLACSTAPDRRPFDHSARRADLADGHDHNVGVNALTL